MKNMKMKTKLIISFAVPVIFLVVAVIFAVSSMERISGEVDVMMQKQITALDEKLTEVGNDENDGKTHDEKVQMINDGMTQARQEDMDIISRTIDLSEKANVILAVVAVFIVAFLALKLLKEVSRAVKQLASAAKDIALGKTDIKMVKYNNDEFGELVDEYTAVIDNIKYQANIAEEVARGNLTVQVDPKSADDLLGNSLKKLVEDNQHALSNIGDAASQVTVGASQVADASQSLAQGSTEQASAIEQITASIDEIADKTKQNAEQANSAAELVVQAISDVKMGNRQMQDMMEAMKDINKSSESISKIIKVIDDIAFQTNILALNAAVEAARAGEAGKGFAVVAEEVRSLAAKSAAAAAETAELIEDSIVKVGTGSKIADDTAKALDVITDVVEKSEVIINGIAEVSNYQTTAVVQIEQAITQVSQVVQTNSATSEQCAAASEELSNQATRMHDLLSIYNTGSDSGSASFRGDSSMSASKINMNEQIISLGDGFDKY